MNTCLLGKLVWDLIQSSEKLWVSILSNKYVVGHNILQATNNSNNSPIWSSIIKAKNALKVGYSWCVGSVSSSFWFTRRSFFGVLGSLVPYIDIHDLHLTVKDVLTSNDPHTNILPSNTIYDHINLTHMNFNDTEEDPVLWNNQKNGIHTPKSGYIWLLNNSDRVDQTNTFTLRFGFGSFVFPKNINFFFG